MVKENAWQKKIAIKIYGLGHRKKIENNSKMGWYLLFSARALSQVWGGGQIMATLLISK